jgi:hypothetical protein
MNTRISAGDLTSQSAENKKAHIAVGFKDQAGTWVFLVAEARFELATFGL